MENIDQQFSGVQEFFAPDHLDQSSKVHTNQDKDTSSAPHTYYF